MYVPLTASHSSLLTLSQEVAEYQAECRTVSGIASEIKEIIDSTHRQCNELGKASNAIPTALVDPILKLQMYVRGMSVREVAQHRYLIDASIGHRKP